MFERDYWETAMKEPKFDHECRLVQPMVVVEHNHEPPQFPDPRTYRGLPLPPEPASPGAGSARDLLREQSELISKYAAYCESKEAICSSVATLLTYRERAKLAREMSFIYFRAATLED